MRLLALAPVLLSAGCQCGFGAVNDCGGRSCDGGVNRDGGPVPGCAGTLIFESAVVATDTAPYAVAAGDLDGDGRADLAVVNQLAQNVTVLRAKSDGTFQTAATLATELRPSHVVMVDLDGDGQLDLVVSNAGSDSLSIFSGAGNLTFCTPTRISVGGTPMRIVAADVNRDGRLDLLMANDFGSNVSLLVASDDGGFLPLSSLNPGIGRLQCLAAADFDGDGWLDLALGGVLSTGVTVYPSRGDGVFGTPRSYGTIAEVSRVAAADFDSDGVADLAAANGSVVVMRGRAGGGFESQKLLAADGGNGLLALDFDGDGRSDVVTVAERRGLVLHGDGKGGFSFQSAPAVGYGPHDLAAADFDGDGTLDLAVTNFNDNTLTILRRIGCAP